MNSPITGKEMKLSSEERTLAFRKEEYPVIYQFYLCEGSGEQFTTTGLDELNLQQLYNAYRSKHHIPFSNEIKTLRKQYGLSAKKMSEILGFGVNSYRNYESGEIPNLSNGKYIQLARDPKKFYDIVELSEALNSTEKKNLLSKVENTIDANRKSAFTHKLEEYFFSGQSLPSEFTGYRKPSMERLSEMVLFFAKAVQPWTTQLNKLLFYADFLNFKRTCFSMSGVRYRAINMGPVPNNYQSIFEYMANKSIVDVQDIEFNNGASGEQFKANPAREFNKDKFTIAELDILNEVADRMGKMTTKEIVDASHREQAWINNESDRKIISYKYAFELCEI